MDAWSRVARRAVASGIRKYGMAKVCYKVGTGSRKEA
jgi:hypothetical protein